MLSITTDERRALRAKAHALKPVVMISENGLSEPVLKEIDRNLIAHGLIKIRVFNDDRELRDSQLAEICDSLGAAPVQHIGKLLVVWRPMPAITSTGSRRRSEARRTKRSFQGSER
jgi:putative YhbY family RNA-binding protein